MQFTSLISAAIVGFAALARAQHMNAAGLALLTEFEGYRADFYQDTSGELGKPLVFDLKSELTCLQFRPQDNLLRLQ